MKWARNGKPLLLRLSIYTVGKHIQAVHAIDIWTERMPVTKLRLDIKTAVNNIHPPGSNDKLKDLYHEASSNFISNIHDITLHHRNDTLQRLKLELQDKTYRRQQKRI